MKKILLAMILLYASQKVMAQPQNLSNPFPKTITVEGSAEMEIIPDEIYVNIQLREYQKKGENKKDLESIKSNFLQACRNVGIPDSAVSISSYSGFNSYYWWRKNRKRDPNLMATITYQVKFRNSVVMDNLIEVLDDEATQNFLIVSTSHSKISEFKKQLKIQAVKAAKEKGIYLTEAIGEKLGGAITIKEPGEISFIPLQRNEANFVFRETELYKYKEGLDKGIIQEVDFKKIKLKYDVSVIFALQ